MEQLSFDDVPSPLSCLRGRGGHLTLNKMLPSDYEWWIDQETRESDGKVKVTRLHHYGPFRDETSAERQIEELSRTERYRRIILVPSKQRRRD